MTSHRSHVIPVDDGWKVVKDERGKVVTFKTQKEAVSAAKRALTKKGGGELVLHGRDGRIREADQVGRSRIGRDVKDPAGPGRLTKTAIRRAVWNGSKAIEGA